jgi:predicted TIM-barrel fold metal-dependent hydrolase
VRFDSLLHVTRSGAWLNGRDDASFARLKRELDRGHVTRGCLVGLAGIVDDEYVLQCANDTGGRLVPVAGVDPTAVASDSANRSMASLRERGFRGVKLHPRLNGYDPLDSKAIAVISAASEAGLIVFLDTLFRQRARSTSSAADIIDRIATTVAGAPIVLLHAGGPALLEVAEIVRLHHALVLDVSYTLLAYAGSSLDEDLRWVLGHLDQRVVVGSDMPEHTPFDAFRRVEHLMEGLRSEKIANVSYSNMMRLFP